MKIKAIVTAMLAVSLLAACESQQEEQHEAAAKQEKLMALAKVSKEDATRTVMAKVPNGTIKEAELEKEHGKLIWSFDVATADTKDITEVNVDAITGQIVSVEKEKAESEKKEKD